jgi:hypothetical protein
MRKYLLGLVVCANVFAASPLVVGARGGMGLTDSFGGVAGRFGSGLANRQYLLGPTAGVRLPLGFSVEGDALWRRETLGLGIGGLGGLSTHFDSWQFPVMLRYTAGENAIAPVLGAGVSVRRLEDFGSLLAAGSTSSTSVGFVAGAGLRFKAGPVNITPEMRYTRWNSTGLVGQWCGLRSDRTCACPSLPLLQQVPCTLRGSPVYSLQHLRPGQRLYAPRYLSLCPATRGGASMFRNTICAFALAGLTGFSGWAQQEQQEPSSVRDLCVKAAPGKSAEFETFLREVGIPLNRSRVEAGEAEWFAVLRPVAVASTSPQCDYRIVFGYKGLPPETPGPAQIDAALKRAKLSMTASDWMARRDALSTLVSQEIWYGIDSVGPPFDRNSYLQMNHYKVKAGRFEEWTKLETGFWKPLVAMNLEQGGKSSWAAVALRMPQGDSLPYNAMTVDVFPDWNSLIRGVPMDQLWPKLHADLTLTKFFERLDDVRERHSVDVYRVTEAARGKTAISSR